MKIKVTPHTISIEREQDINAGEYQVSSCEFEFTEEYEDLTCNAIFSTCEESYQVAIFNRKCDIPSEVLETPGQVLLGVYGYELDGTDLKLRYSPTPKYFNVIKGSYKEGEEPTPPTPSVIDQLQEQINQNANDIEDLQEDIGDINSTIEGIDNTIDGIHQDIHDLDETKANINDLSQVAFTGEYTDLLNKPNLSVYATNTELGEEITNRENADRGLQEQIDAITSSSDVKDIVGTYAELQAYDTSKLGKDDIIKVLQDSTHNNASTYYRWNLSTWVYIGAEGPYYTKSETDTMLQPYVKNTDYATSSKGGVLKIDQNYGLRVSNGTLIGYGVNYNDYQSALNQLVVDKGTLENVITGKELTNKTYVDNADILKEDKSNKVTSISSSSTDTQYPSAKCMYDSQEEQNEQIEKANMIYNVLPRVEGSGASVSLDNTAKCPMELEPKANTLTQETTTGKNLLNIDDSNKKYTSVSSENITKSGNNVSMKIPSGDTNCYAIYLLGNISDFVGKTLTLSLDTNIDSVFSSSRFVNCNTAGEYRANIGGTLGSATSLTITIPEDTYSQTQLAVRLYASGTGGNTYIVEKPMVEIGATATTWENYTGGIPQPNPSYPSEVHTISGDNEIRVSEENLFDMNWLNASDITVENGIATGTAKNFTKAFQFNAGGIPNTNYEGQVSISISAYTNGASSTTGNGLNFGIIYTDGTATNAQFLNSTSTKTTKTITSDVSKQIQFLRITYNAGDNNIWYLSDIMVTYGDTPQTYKEYKGTNYPITLPVENLFNVTIEQGSISSSNGSTTSSNTRVRTSDFINATKGTYTLSMKNQENLQVYLHVYDTSEQYISSENSGGFKTLPYTFDIEGNRKIKFVIAFSSGNIVPSDVTEVQLEKGTKANSYTPYGTTPIEMCGIGNYEDKFFKAIEGNPIYDSLDNTTKGSLTSGMWYLQKNIGKIIYNGSENWILSGTQITGSLKVYNQVRLPNNNENQVSYALSNLFLKIPLTDYQNARATGITPQNAGLNVCIKDTTMTKEQFQTFLGTNNLIMYYNQTTPSYILLNNTLQTQLNAIEKALSYQNQTNISQSNNDLPFVIKASAIYDLSDLVTRVADLEV